MTKSQNCSLCIRTNIIDLKYKGGNVKLPFWQFQMKSIASWSTDLHNNNIGFNSSCHYN